jgi:hypothetical protein
MQATPPTPPEVEDIITKIEIEMKAERTKKMSYL